MKVIPPEILEAITYLVTAVLGWLARYFQKKKETRIGDEVLEKIRINKNQNK